MQQNKRSRHSGPLIKLADYARIHAILRAVMDGVDANTTKACIFFSVAGAYLLSKHHRLDARPIAGAAFYGYPDFCVGPTVWLGKMSIVPMLDSARSRFQPRSGLSVYRRLM